MAEETTTTTDTTDAAETVDTTTDGPGAKAKTYSKAELDAIANKRVAAARREYADYNEVKAKAEELDRLQESSKTEEAKLRDRADRADRARDAALTRANQSIIRSAIVSVASRLGAVDPEAVAALLPQSEIVLEGDEVIGVEEAVKALLAKKPYLRAQGAARAGAEIQGGGGEATVFTRSQIRQLARTGGLTPEIQKQIETANKAGRVLDR